MERRNFLKLITLGPLALGSITLVGGRWLWRTPEQTVDLTFEDIPESPAEILRGIQHMSTPAPNAEQLLAAFQEREERRLERAMELQQDSLEKYFAKMQDFDGEHFEDVHLSENEFRLLVKVFKHLDRVQTLVGHGNFNVISFDEMIKAGEDYSSVGSFQKDELDFIDSLFSENPQRYGFFGEKVTQRLTSVVNDRDRIKIPHTGHFLFRGRPQKLYEQVKKDVGESVVLTSGIRSVVKQTHLFLAKSIQAHGNLSRASRSLAPPGHSFHGIGDFDVGKVGYGLKNFTSDFAETNEYHRLVDLGYLQMRYPEHNLVGVRYEPWHVKVV